MTHYAVIGLQYGDEAKGLVTARLCADNDIAWVVRFNGGCQAAHNVITDDGRHHTFSQFGAGTFSGVKTFLSKYMLVEPFSLINEAQHLADLGVPRPMRRVVIDPEALLTTPYHWELNQWQEDQRGENRHGSTGRGIGMTALFEIEHPYDAPRIGDIYQGSVFKIKLGRLRTWCIEQGCPEERLPTVHDLYERYLDIEADLTIMKLSWTRILKQDQVVFEGAQGVLLDQDHGFHPYTTWSKTTDANVRSFFEDAGAKTEDLKTIGVTRAYMTRHGAGPFVTEVREWANTGEQHNKAEHYQGDWRVGYQDLVALQYAIECCTMIDQLYVTHTDAPAAYLDQVAIAYGDGYNLVTLEHLVGREARPERQQQTERLLALKPILTPTEPDRLAESLSEALRVPLYGKGHGPRIRDGEFAWEASTITVS